MSRVIVIEVVDTGVVAVDTGVDDRHRYSGTGVSCVLPDKVDAVNRFYVLHLDFKSTIEFDEDDAGLFEEFVDTIQFDCSGDRID